MKYIFKNKYLQHELYGALFGVLSVFGSTATAQTWTPTKNVEIVVGSAPGGSNDKTGRSIEKLLNELKLVPTSLTVVNKPGGGGNLMFSYVNQHAGDAHYLMVGTTAMVSNHIVGSSKLSYLDFTPIASLMNDYIVFAVNSDSPLKTGKDLLERLKTKPQSLSIGFASAFGNSRHIGAGMLMRAIGGNPDAARLAGIPDAQRVLLGWFRDSRCVMVEDDAEDLFRRVAAFASFGFAKSHAAAFAFERAVGFAGGTKLTVTLSFNNNTGHGIGRPRLSLSSAEKPELTAPATSEQISRGSATRYRLIPQAFITISSLFLTSPPIVTSASMPSSAKRRSNSGVRSS